MIVQEHYFCPIMDIIRKQNNYTKFRYLYSIRKEMVITGRDTGATARIADYLMETRGNE